jgi:hypothetical protein
MKKLVVIYGIIAGFLVLGISALIFVVLGDQFSHSANEIFGYLIMVIGLSIIFVAVKQYRDKHLGGIIKFRTAFLMGLYISLIASSMYVINWEIYMQTSDTGEFIENYQQSIIDRMEADGATQAEIQEQKEENDYYKKMYSNPLFRIPITFSEILPVGLLISILSAALLRKSEFLPADEPGLAEEPIT